MKSHLTGFCEGGFSIPRIPEALIERLKAETSLEALAAARGVNSPGTVRT